MNGCRVAFMGFCCPRPFTFFSRESICPVRIPQQMKQLLILCLLSLPAQAHGQETSPTQLPLATTDQTQPLPRSKDGQKKSSGAKKPGFDPIDKIEKVSRPAGSRLQRHARKRGIGPGHSGKPNNLRNPHSSFPQTAPQRKTCPAIGFHRTKASKKPS